MKTRNAMLRKILPITIATALSVSSMSYAKDELYFKGQELLDQKQWSEAQVNFSRMIKQKSEKSDAAFYWLAYAQNQENQSDKALNNLNRLIKEYPGSEWVDDAKVLVIEINDKKGEALPITDDEMKLYAMDSLLHSSPEKATATLKKLLNGNHSEKAKKRALFVLSQLDDPEAFTIISELALSGESSEIRHEAIDTLGISGATGAMEVLTRVYEMSSEVELKSRVLRSFMLAKNSDALVSVVTTETDEELKTKAIKWLGVMGSHQHLISLYQGNQLHC